MGQLRLRRAAFIGIVALTLLGGATAALISRASSADALTNCTVSDLAMDGEETAFLGLINTYRAQNGLGALTVSTNLNRAASWMVIDLGTRNYFSHTDSLGRAPAQRSIDCGYPLGAGENLAAGTVWDTAQEAFDAWRASAGHNQNMLASYYKQIGIARYFAAGSIYGWYWATDFGTTNDGTGSGGGAPATPTAPPAANAPAAITSPANGATLPGASASFAWAAGSGALEYFLYVGTSQGTNNLYGASQGLGRSATIGNLPTNGSTVYVRLWTRFASGWQFADTSYRSATASQPGGGGATTQTKAALVSPTPGTTLFGSTQTFNWTTGSAALEYLFYLGTSPGANDLIGQSVGAGTTITVSNLPAHGQSVYVRLWTRFASGWQFTDYTYTTG
jgi:uncharacterized protein YkwD